VIAASNCLISDDKCNGPIVGALEGWYPGIGSVDDNFRKEVGSYMCKNGSTSADCPGAGPANPTTSVSIARATSSRYLA